MSARDFSTSLLVLLLPSALLAQDDCGDLSIASIHYSAFDPSIVEVRTLNAAGWGFSYPWLILYDGNGDTLAWDYANFFVIGPDQTFLLPVTGANVPVGPFSATVELWTNSDLACTFELQADLCPPAPCAEVYPFVIDQSGGSSGHECSWVVADTNGFTVATGTLVIPVGSTQTRDTVCLAPGTYSLGMTEVSGTGGNMQFWMSSEWWSSSTSPHVWIDSSAVSSFVLYERCIDDANTVPDLVAAGMELTVVNGILSVQGSDGFRFREVEVMDAAGRFLREVSGGDDGSGLDITGLAAGLLVVRARDVEGGRVAGTIFWTP